MAYEIQIEPGNHRISAEVGESILDAAMRQGLRLPYSCRNGTCGSCRGRIVSGTVSYPKDISTTLSAQEQSQGWALFCQAVPQENMVVEAGEVLTEDSDIEIKMLPCRVSVLQRLTHNVMGLTLKIPEAAVFHYRAGQYIDILLRDGRRRSYSIANANQDQGLLELHIRHMPGGAFSEHVFTALKEKDLLRFRGPYGAFVWRRESSRPAILVATGTGFAPIKALLEQAFSEKYERPLHLYWGNRQPQDFYLLELLNGWQQTYDNFSFTPVLSKPQDGDDWQGRYGWVQDAVLADYPGLSAYDIYASGSPAMVASAKAAFTERGLVTDHYYSDAFVKAGD